MPVCSRDKARKGQAEFHCAGKSDEVRSQSEVSWREREAKRDLVRVSTHNFAMGQVNLDTDAKKRAPEAPQAARRPALIDQCIQTTDENPGSCPYMRGESRDAPTWADSSDPSAWQASNSQQASETIRKLAVELAACQCRATSLAEENNRLMEFSCKLRAAWEHAVAAVLQNNRATSGVWFGRCDAASASEWRDPDGQLEMVLQRRGPPGACRVHDWAPAVQLALPNAVERVGHTAAARCEGGCDVAGDAAGQLSRREVR
jgi:hypothetical protein